VPDRQAAPQRLILRQRVGQYFCSTKATFREPRPAPAD
jgi:hypothetical protein